MRFVLAASIFAAAVSAGIYQTKSENGSVIMTTSTVYSTTTSTIISCASTVTNCPAHPELQTETQTVTSVIAVSTTVCPVTASMSSSSAAPIKQSTYSKSFPVGPVSASTCPTVTETCTVTVTAECQSSYYSHPSGVGKPSGTGSPVKPSSSVPLAVFTGAANANNAGAFIAGAGALAALLL